MAFTLYYPETGSVIDSVELPSPTFGNQVTLQTNAIVRETLGGTLKVYKDRNWVSTEIFQYPFQYVVESVIEELKEFVATTAGLKIRYVDHFGDTHYGYIYNDNLDFITVRDGCAYDVVLEILSWSVPIEDVGCDEEDGGGALGGGTGGVVGVGGVLSTGGNYGNIDSDLYYYIVTEDEADAISDEAAEALVIEEY